jgi:hypothetical protein
MVEATEAQLVKFRRRWVTFVVATAVSLACLGLTASALAGPHLHAGRSYKGMIKAGSADRSIAYLILHTTPGPGNAKSGRFGLYCQGDLVRTSPIFPITQVRTKAEPGEAKQDQFKDIFSSVFPLPALGTFDAFGRVVSHKTEGPIPRARLTVRSVPGCRDLNVRGIKTWFLLSAKKDNTRIRQIRDFHFNTVIGEVCPTQSDIGDPVGVGGGLSPDNGGTTITITEQSSLEAAPTTTTVQTAIDGGFFYSFTPQPDDVITEYTQSMTMRFDGDLLRTPASISCSWQVLPS